MIVTGTSEEKVGIVVAFVVAAVVVVRVASVAVVIEPEARKVSGVDA